MTDKIDIAAELEQIEQATEEGALRAALYLAEITAGRARRNLVDRLLVEHDIEPCRTLVFRTGSPDPFLVTDAYLLAPDDPGRVPALGLRGIELHERRGRLGVIEYQGEENRARIVDLGYDWTLEARTPAREPLTIATPVVGDGLRPRIELEVDDE